MKKSKSIKIFVIILIVINIFTLSACAVLLKKSGYGEKILVKLGVLQPTPKTSSAVLSWNSCLENLNLDVDVVFFGNSITRGSSFQNYFTDVSICNLGLSGDNLANMKMRAKMIGSVKPEKIFIMAGINDLSNYYGDLKLIINRYESLLDSICTQCPDAQIYIESLLPVNTKMHGNAISPKSINQFNTLLEEMAQKRNLTYINLYDLYVVDNALPEELTFDGLHLNPEAYDMWAQAIRKYIE